MARVAKRHLFGVFAVVTAIAVGATIGFGSVYLFKHRHNLSILYNNKNKLAPPAKIVTLNHSEQLQSDALNANLNGDKSGAAKAADQAIAAASSDAEKARAYMSKASICFTAKSNASADYPASDYACAAPSYAQASDLVQTNIGYAGAAAQAYEKAGDKTNALKYYQRALPFASDKPNPDGTSGKQVIEAKIKELGG
jgi:hypothetical protein